MLKMQELMYCDKCKNRTSWGKKYDKCGIHGFQPGGELLRKDQNCRHNWKNPAVKEQLGLFGKDEE